MSQSFIDALMHFYALIFFPLPGRKLSNIRQSLQDYIDKAAIVFPAEECIKLYNSYSGRYFFEFSNHAYKTAEETLSIHRHLVLTSGVKAQANLYMQERLVALLSLLEFSGMYFPGDESLQLNIRELSRSLNIPDEDYIHALEFINASGENSGLVLGDQSGEAEELEGLWIEEHTSDKLRLQQIEIGRRIRGRIRFKYFGNYSYLAFIYEGNQTLYLNSNKIYSQFFYTLSKKDLIEFENSEPINYDELIELFNPAGQNARIRFSGKNVSYKYKSTHFSIKPFSFSEESGQLIGILGNNGSGKSTLLKLISNQIPNRKGKICLNGADTDKNRYKLQSILAYVPHEDLIHPELSVYDNLKFQAKLCLGNMKDKEIEERIENTLKKFQLEHLRNEKAGSSVDHRIGAFARICLRMSVEMLRNPYIICLDEPLSGLSYSESRKLLSILKEETIQGRLVFLTAQMPATELFHMLDKIWLMDEEGYMIYNGAPSRSLTYLKNTGLLPYYYIQSRVDKVSPEDLMKIVEAKKIGPDGSLTRERQVSAGAWYDAFLASSAESLKDAAIEENKPLPALSTPLPGIERQAMFYYLRNVKVWLSRFPQNLLFTAGFPAIGFIVAMSIRLLYGRDYSLGINELMTVFIFVSVNLMFMAGFVTAAADVLPESRLVWRDKLLNISIFSYKNAKVYFLAMISLVQSFLYTILTNYVLEIEGLTGTYLMVYFCLAFTGNLVALALSPVIGRLSNFYLIMVFLMIPSLLYTGKLIPFDKTGYIKGNMKGVPVVAEIIPARWAYEALVVKQYSDNLYNRHLFDLNMKGYYHQFMIHHTLPLLENALAKTLVYYEEDRKDSLYLLLDIFRDEFEFFGRHNEIAPFESIDALKKKDFNTRLYDQMFGYITYLRFLSETMVNESETAISRRLQTLSDSIGPSKIEEFREKHHNMEIDHLLTRPSHQEFAGIEEGKMVKRGVPVFMDTSSVPGKEQFFSSRKRLNEEMDILRFNLSVLWMITLVFYILYISGGLGLLLKEKQEKQTE